MLAGLNDITGGGIILAGKELDGPGPDRGVVFQSPCLLPWMTAFENVMLGIDQVFYTAGKQERREIAEYYLTVVGLGDAMHKKPAQLSQGMRQRVGIARAFALHPKMLLLDEPFGMLDSLTRFELQQVLIELWRKNKITALMVTHDVDEALFLSDRIACMTNGPEAQIGDILEVTFPRPRDRKAVLEHPDYYRLREHLITFLEEQAHHTTCGENGKTRTNGPNLECTTKASGATPSPLNGERAGVRGEDAEDVPQLRTPKQLAHPL